MLLSHQKKISFEVFPPKKEDNFDSAFQVTADLAALHPTFISVTYGAGGSRSKQTAAIAGHIQNTLHLPAIAHLTCVGSKKGEILRQCQMLREKNITRVLALRGDRPKDMDDAQFNRRDFPHALDLISFLRENTDLDLWAACYPETHPESVSPEDDLLHMKQKQDAGVSQFVTQMFFDNDVFYRFRDNAAAAGITAPIHAGIMPITAASQLGTSVTLSGAAIPETMARMFAKYENDPQAMHQAGIDYAARQIDDLLAQGVDGVHIYTMNKPQNAADILTRLH